LTAGSTRSGFEAFRVFVTWIGTGTGIDFIAFVTVWGVTFFTDTLVFTRSATYADGVLVTRQGGTVIDRFATFTVTGVTFFTGTFVSARTGHGTGGLL
jgi:hypothetical protein